MKRPFVFCLLGIVLSCTQIGSADEPLKKKPTISLPRCRIMFVDKVTLSNRIDGLVEFIEPEEGDSIQGNQVVAKLDDSIVQAELEFARKDGAENDVGERLAKKSAEVAQAILIQAEEKERTGSVSDIESKRLRLEFQAKQLAIEQAQALWSLKRFEVKKITARLQTYRIAAVFDGVVTKIYKHKGEFARAGDPILELVNTRHMRVEGFIDVDQVVRVKRGDAVKVELGSRTNDANDKGSSFEGKIVFIDLTVQPVTQQVRIWAEVTNRNSILRNGLRAKMTSCMPAYPHRPTSHGFCPNWESVFLHRTL